MFLFRSLLATAYWRPAAPVLERRLRLPLDEGLKKTIACFEART